MPEFEEIKRCFPDALTIGIETDPAIRHERWRRRGLTFDDTWEQREWQERSWGTAKLISQCDVAIQGDSGGARKAARLVRHVRGSAAGG